MAKTDIKLDHLSVDELTHLINDAKNKRSAKQQTARTQLIKEITAKAAQLGLTFETLMGGPASSTNIARKVRGEKTKLVPVKYSGPENKTWTGRGRMPRWLTATIERGKSKSEFTV